MVHLTDDEIQKVAKVVAAYNPPMFKKSDGNGGHVRDWKKTGYAVLVSVVAIIIGSLITTGANHVFSYSKIDYRLSKLEMAIDKMAGLQDIYHTVNLNKQNELIDRVNDDTTALHNHLKTPCPVPITRRSDK